jgi:hypothetical protein
VIRRSDAGNKRRATASAALPTVPGAAAAVITTRPAANQSRTSQPSRPAAVNAA